ncbi:hypothetical protein CABS03_05903 [Colletotrichum abscissum]
MPSYSYRIHANGHASPAGRPRAKQQRQSRCGREREPHTPTHYYAYTRTSHHRSVPQRPVCYFCPFLVFLQPPPPFACRVSKLFPLSLSKSRGAAAAGTATLWRGRARGGQPNPGRQVADDQVAAQARARGRETCRKAPHLPQGRVRGLGKGRLLLLHTEAGSRNFQSYSVQRRNSNRWSCLAAPPSQFGARCAPPSPLLGLSRQPWAAVFGGHIHASRLPM